MLDSEKFVVKSILDTLADMLRVSRLEDWQSDEYFESLKKYSHDRFLSGVKKLQENYEPRRSNDFPVLKVIHQACSSVQTQEKNPTWECRCCKVPFPAGSDRLNCPCLMWEHCFRCDKCHNHCKCPAEKRISVDEISAQAVAEFDRIMKSHSASQKRSEKENSALKPLLPTRSIGTH